MGGNPLKHTDPTGETIAHSIRGAFWAGGRIGAVINYGVQAATGATIGSLIYDALNDNIYNSSAAPGDVETDAPDGPFSWVDPDRKTNNDKLKSDWEDKYGEDWPVDPDTGKDMDPSHEIPLADGGPDHVSNIKPRTKRDHRARHKSRGDFRRWGKRARRKRNQCP